MRILLCAIGRLENNYIREWVEHYQKIGFDNICLYDNNRDGEENFEDIIGDYIDEGFVVIENYRNKTKCQLEAYDECYNKYGKDYDWIAFFDCDEFLETKRGINIKTLLANDRYDNYQVICPCWKNYNDNGLLDVIDGNYSRTRFTQEADYPLDNKTLKSIVRTAITNFKFNKENGNPHGGFAPGINACNSDGNRCNYEKPTDFIMKNAAHNFMWVAHYRYKTIGEFCDKVTRGYPDGNYVPIDLEYFWKYNEKTEEKIALYKKKLEPYTSKLKVALCAIGRLENKYIREWVIYNKTAGFDKIFLYDNNRDGEDNFYDVIGDFIKVGFVTLIDYRNRVKCQLKAYQECYDTYGKDYDWIAFFDCDEFITFKQGDDIRTYLSKNTFQNTDLIHINWLNYDDNGKTHYEEGSVVKRFPSPRKPLDAKAKYDFPENLHIKTIIKGGLEGVKWESTPHTPKPCSLRCVTADGLTTKAEYPITGQAYYRNAFLRHYPTKTIEEYVTCKMQRGFPDHDKQMNKKILTLDYFFSRNEKTKEKEELAEKLIKEFEESRPQKRKDAQLFMMVYRDVDFVLRDDTLVSPLQVGAEDNLKRDLCTFKDNTGDNISKYNKFFIENTGIYWIWKNIKDAKYKGQMGYRRQLDLAEDTNFDEIFKDHDIICAKPFIFSKDAWIPEETIEKGYIHSHNFEDLYKVELLIKKLYPDYYDDYVKYIKNGNKLYYSNGWVMKTEDYDKYCQFLFNILISWLKITKIGKMEDLLIYVTRNIYKGKYRRYNKPDEVRYGAIRWQAEIGGFLSERIFTLYVLHNFKNIYEVEYIKKENIPL